jgi:hypothetical protein
MPGHRRWSDIRNAAMDEPLHRHLRDELRRANDLAQKLVRLRDRRAAVTAPERPAADGMLDADEVAIHETEYLAALRESIEDLGGRLDIAAVFPDQRITLAPEPSTDDATSAE